MRCPFNLEAALHEQSPFEIGLFPGKLDYRTQKAAEASEFLSGLKIHTVSPRFVIGTGDHTILCDTSYEGCIVISFYANDCYDEWKQLLDRKTGSLPCDMSVKAHYDPNACRTFDQELFAWINSGCKADYDFRFRL